MRLLNVIDKSPTVYYYIMLQTKLTLMQRGRKKTIAIYNKGYV